MSYAYMFVRGSTHGPSMQVQQQLAAAVPNSTFPRAKTECACFDLQLIPDGEHKRFTASERSALTPTPPSQAARVFPTRAPHVGHVTAENGRKKERRKEEIKEKK